MILPLLVAAAAAAPADYRQAANWLCRPGTGSPQDACSGNIIVPTPPVADCFYVYPTTSMDPSPNSDLVPGIEERGTAHAQFAAFGGVCRRFAPLYRQVTLPGLRSLFGKTPMPIDRETPYADVLAAWRDYLARDNGGRPFVLIGHSQGANALRRLVAEEIDGKPVQARMLSAILAGATIAVPAGKDVGGDFRAVRLCRSATQTGCVVTWASYRGTAPANTLFGRTNTPGMVAGCTNPAALGGGRAKLDAVMGFPWWQGGVAQYRPPEGTPADLRYTRVAGLTGECRSGGGTTYLSIDVARDTPLTLPAAIGDAAYPEWGWHVVDISVVQGDLVRLVATQSRAWRARN